MEARDAAKHPTKHRAPPQTVTQLQVSMLPWWRKPSVKDVHLQIYGPAVLPSAYNLEEFLSLHIFPILYIDRLLNF